MEGGGTIFVLLLPNARSPRKRELTNRANQRRGNVILHSFIRATSGRISLSLFESNSCNDDASMTWSSVLIGRIRELVMRLR